MSLSLRKIPGFRSGKWWKVSITSGFYLFVFLTILAVLSSSAPTLALDKIDPTSKNSVSIAGKTHSNKPVYLLKDNKIVQSIKSDSSGKFYFALNDLKDGNYTYTIETCNSEKKDKCKSENVLITVDQTPPPKPEIALPNKLPNDSEEEIAERIKPQGIPSMQQDGIMKVLAGVTSLDELERVVDLYAA